MSICCVPLILTCMKGRKITSIFGILGWDPQSRQLGGYFRAFRHCSCWNRRSDHCCKTGYDELIKKCPTPIFYLRNWCVRLPTKSHRKWETKPLESKSSKCKQKFSGTPSTWLHPIGLCMWRTTSTLSQMGVHRLALKKGEVRLKTKGEKFLKNRFQVFYFHSM